MFINWIYHMNLHQDVGYSKENHSKRIIIKQII